MIRFLWLMLPALFGALSLSAQNRYPIVFSAEYPENLTEISGQTSFIQDTTGILYAGFSYGVVEFDGKNKRLCHTPEPVLGLAVSPQNNLIYAACQGSFGFLKRRPDGLAEYVVLKQVANTDSGEAKFYGRVGAAENRVYFYYADQLFGYDPAANKTTEIPLNKAAESAPGLIQLGARVFVNTAEGLSEIKDDKLTPVAGAAAYKGKPFLHSAAFDDKSNLVVFLTGELAIFDGAGFKPWGAALGRRSWNGAAKIGDQFALSTENKGCFIVSANGNLIAVLDVNHGLPETEIYGLYGDRNGLLWLGHGRQFAWANLKAPLNRYSQGIYGNINDIEIVDKPYIATDEGVYKLTDYRSTGVLDEQKVLTVLNEAETQKQEILKTEAVVEDKTKWQQYKDKQREKNGVLGKVFKKKGKKEVEIEEKNAEAVAKVEEKKATVRQESQKIQALKQVLDESKQTKLQRSDFMRVMGLPEIKFADLARANGQLLAASASGLFVIADTRGVKQGGPGLRRLMPSRSGGRVWALPMGAGAGSFAFSGGGWVYSPIGGVNEYINSFAEDASGGLWLGAEKGILSVSGGSVKRLLNAEGANAGQTRVYSMNGQIVAVQNGKSFLMKGGQFTEAPELNAYLGVNENVIVADQGAYSWLLSGKRLFKATINASGNLTLADSTQAFGVAGRLAAMKPVGDVIWAGSGTNLYQLNTKNIAKDADKRRFSVAIRQIQVDGVLVNEELANNELNLPAADNYDIQFTFAGASFENREDLRFQYRFGSDQAWKTLDGVSLNRDFTFGSFELQVRAVDAYGNTSSPVRLAISINTPIYAQPWFWPLVVTLALGGIVALFVMRQRALVKRKKELEDEVARQTEEIRRQRDTIQLEKDISEGLLLNILPNAVAQELKVNGKAVARHYDQVTVLFTDFKGFTNVAEKLSPSDLIVELDRCFAKFDEILDKHGLEKIKTIGDAYMCAGGVPVPNKTNAIDAVLAGLEFQQYMVDQMNEKKKNGQAYWELRLGIHTGPLVAGVIGKKKFAYDIWGDTVNTASRMESSGEPNKVNISGTTHDLVKDFFVCTFRGKVAAKNKGEVEMYFVETIAPELSKNKDGKNKNDAFDKKVKERFA